MLEKPTLQDETIIVGIHDHYGIPVTEIKFLPIGNDSSAWVFRVDTHSHGIWFLKVKRGALYEPSVMVPHFLNSNGIEQVVAPLPTKTKTLWAILGDFVLVLYPFINGGNGHEISLSDTQWIEYGVTLKRIHTIKPAPAILEQVPQETFAPKGRWVNAISTVEKRIAAGDLQGNVYEKAMATFWQEKRAKIRQIVARTEVLGRALQQKAPGLVLCHADIHIFNLMIDHDSRLHIVDWDETLLAPIERDLMFIDGATDRKKALFYRGYGKIEIDALALAFYRYEWVVQEIGDYGERVFLADNIGEATREDAVREFVQLFAPGDMVDAAYRADGLH